APDADDCRDPFRPDRSAGFAGESTRDFPISDLPRLIRVMVVAWWMCARSWSSRVEYIFSYSSSSSMDWKIQSLAGGRKLGSMKISHRMCQARKLDSLDPACVNSAPCVLSRQAAPIAIMDMSKRFGVLS